MTKFYHWIFSNKIYLILCKIMVLLSKQVYRGIIPLILVSSISLPPCLYILWTSVITQCACMIRIPCGMLPQQCKTFPYNIWQIPESHTRIHRRTKQFMVWRCDGVVWCDLFHLMCATMNKIIPRIFAFALPLARNAQRDRERADEEWTKKSILEIMREWLPLTKFDSSPTPEMDSQKNKKKLLHHYLIIINYNNEM